MGLRTGYGICEEEDDEDAVLTELQNDMVVAVQLQHILATVSEILQNVTGKRSVPMII